MILFTFIRIPVPVTAVKRWSAEPKGAISCAMGLSGGTTAYNRRPGTRDPRTVPPTTMLALISTRFLMMY